MARYYGKIGFGITKEYPIGSGVWRDVVIEREYTGDIFRISRRYDTGEGVNDNVDVNNEISIVADPFAMERISNILYVTWYGQKWKVGSITVDYPRLRLSIGGVYNGEVPIEPPDDSGESSGDS